jgi:DNA-binding HxlR family transcriptional regulator
VSEAPRSYDDPCGIARALDAVGERWSLLIVRELVFSPKRFTDLRRGLGGMSPNVLSQRLADLERDGVVQRRVAGPPVGAPVYELTGAGHHLLPVLEALARWGNRRPIRSDRPLSRDALMLALRTSVRAGVSVPPGLRLTLDDTSWDPVIEDGTLEWRPPTRATVTATLETSSPTLHRLVFHGLDLAEATADAAAVSTGERSVVVAFLHAFDRAGAGTAAELTGPSSAAQR